MKNKIKKIKNKKIAAIQNKKKDSIQTKRHMYLKCIPKYISYFTLGTLYDK